MANVCIITISEPFYLSQDVTKTIINCYFYLNSGEKNNPKNICFKTFLDTIRAKNIEVFTAWHEDLKCLGSSQSGVVRSSETREERDYVKYLISNSKHPQLQKPDNRFQTYSTEL